MRWIALSLLLLGCGPEESAPATLTGSLAQVYSLRHTGVRARLDARELAIQYVDGGLVPVQVVVDLTSQPVNGPGVIDLTAHGTVTGQRGAARVPTFVSGRLVLDAYLPDDGAPVIGEFEAVVRADGRDLSVGGTFDTTLADIR